MKVAIIGGGPSGLMCACKIGTKHDVYLFDSNEKLGKKLYITGKGRCNVTNLVSEDEFLKNVVRNPKFLYSILSKFNPDDTWNFFESNNTKLKLERGKRVFPISDKASDITRTFEQLLKKNNVTILLNRKVVGIEKIDNYFVLHTTDKKYKFDVVVIATGGKSYSFTGSTGDGYNFARNFGHSIVSLKSALVPIDLKEYNANLSGLTLKNVSAKVTTNKGDFSQFGEMLFTHTGVSGPIILTLSSYINRLECKKLIIDFKPALSKNDLDKKILRDILNFKLIIVKNYLKKLLPTTIIEEFLLRLNINANMRLCEITKEIRQKIIYLLKNFSYDILSLKDIENAIITSGGVDVKQINPRNCESKLVSNLFFVGEVLDVDALTGGFNIQIALSTGYVAGEYISNLQ